MFFWLTTGTQKSDEQRLLNVQHIFVHKAANSELFLHGMIASLVGQFNIWVL